MIREATTDNDIKLIANMAEQIWNEAFADIITKQQIDYMIEKFQSYNAIKQQTGHNNYHYTICMLDNEAVGYCGFQPQDDGTLYLSKMYLKKEARGHGLFTETIDMLKDFCKENNITSIWLTVNKHNERAIAAYEKNGFKNIRSQVADIGNGFVMDDYVYELTVKN